MAIIRLFAMLNIYIIIFIIFYYFAKKSLTNMDYIVILLFNYLFIIMNIYRRSSRWALFPFSLNAVRDVNPVKWFAASPTRARAVLPSRGYGWRSGMRSLSSCPSSVSIVKSLPAWLSALRVREHVHRKPMRLWQMKSDASVANRVFMPVLITLRSFTPTPNGP